MTFESSILLLGVLLHPTSFALLMFYDEKINHDNLRNQYIELGVRGFAKYAVDERFITI